MADGQIPESNIYGRDIKKTHRDLICWVRYKVGPLTSRIEQELRYM
jgi:hypothetical protein